MNHVKILLVARKSRRNCMAPAHAVVFYPRNQVLKKRLFSLQSYSQRGYLVPRTLECTRVCGFVGMVSWHSEAIGQRLRISDRDSELSSLSIRLQAELS